MKNNKKIVLAVVALVAVVAIALGLWVALKPQAAQGEKTITVNVVFADGTQNSHTISTSEEYLRGALATGLNLGRGSGPLDHTFDLVSRFAQSSESV